MSTTELVETSEHDSQAGTAHPRGRALLHFLENWVLLWLLLLVALFFVLNPTTREVFASTENLGLLTGNQAVIILLALAVLCPLVAGHFDFSIGATHALSAVVCAAAMANYGYSLPIAIVLAVAVGLLVGLVNGILVAVFKLNSFIITLGISTLIAGIISWYTNGQTIAAGISESLTGFGSETLFGLPRLVYLVGALVLATWYLLTQTPYGRKLYAIGANVRSARLVGISVDRHVLLSFVIAGFLAGVAGVMAVARTGAATSNNGTSALFPAIAAVFLGATVVQPGRFNVFGTVIGVTFVAVSVSGLTLMGAADWVDPVFNGLALVLAVGLSTLLRRRRTGSADIE